MLRAFFILLILFFLPFIFARSVFSAPSSFDTKITSTYKVHEDFSSDVTHIVQIENKKEYIYAPFFFI